MKFLLDTNTWVEYLRGTSQRIINKLGTLHPSDVVLCSIVLSELSYGVLRSPATQFTHNKNRLEHLRGRYHSLSFDDLASDEAAVIRFELSKLGTPIGANDLLIAAIAHVHGFTLVTHNTREFGRIPNLLIEDWQV